MDQEEVFSESDALDAELVLFFDLPLWDGSSRTQVCHRACSLSMEHWRAVRHLLRSGLLPSGLVVHRAQYEAVVRAVWALYAATDIQVDKLSASLSIETEQASKNLPLIAEMLASLTAKAPSPAVEMLGRFKEASWTALNSYAHAGIHPLQRHGRGYPAPLFEQNVRNANGIALMATIQAAMLTGSQELVGRVYALQYRFIECLPPQD